MVKLIFCLRRIPELSLEEFQTYWRDVHAPLVQSVAPVLGIVRYVQSHVISQPDLQNILIARGITQPYDGVAELWWKGVDEMLARGATDQGTAALQSLYEDEQRFIDLARSEMLFAEELEVISDWSNRPS